MNWIDHSDNDARLDALLQAYREANPDRDASPNFMPELWRRIEERQRSVFFMGRWTRALVTAAAVLTMGMAAWLYIPHGRKSVFTVESYVEALVAGHAQDAPELLADASVDEL